MTLVCSDEAAVVDAQISFHLHAGVDIVVADHGSTAGVADVLEAYAQEGHVHLVGAPADTVPRSERVTHMARLAATELGADWVINADRGEFWWPRGGTFGEVLAAIPKRFGIVRALPRSFVSRPEDGVFFAEGLTFRLSTQALVSAPDGATRSRLGIVHGADPGVLVDGDFALGESSLAPLRGWYPIEVFRLPVHDGEQAIENDSAVAPGLEDGSLVVDTRLRDVLRVLRLPDSTPQGARRFALPSEGAAASFPRPSVVDDAAYAVEVAAFGEADEAVMSRRLDEAERRIALLERTVWDRAGWKLRRLMRRR